MFIGPLVSGSEPRGQKLGVNLLFVAPCWWSWSARWPGEWLSIQNKMTDTVSFYWGHQGYEYVDLGRVWQILLFVGLLLWLFLVVRAIRPALKNAGEQRHLLWLFLMSSAAIGLFYGAGLTWGQHTHLSMVEYWRWWVVHLWVEGFFEVFATTVIAFFFTRLNLIRPGVGGQAALLSATIFLSGGIIGTCHHLYFSGTPTVALAWGSVFSALEVVPLVLVGFDAVEDLRRSRTSPWVQRYKWPIYFFVAVAFWNMVGAGLFGFMINPPIALYLHAGPQHDAAARPRRAVRRLRHAGHRADAGLPAGLEPGVEWKEGWLKFSFLGDEHRPDGDVRREPAAGGPDADLGIGGAGLLVRPQQRVPAHAADANLALAARAGRHDLRRRRAGSGGVGGHPAATAGGLRGGLGRGSGGRAERGGVAPPFPSRPRPGSR